MTARRTPPAATDLTLKKRCGKCRHKKVLDDFHVSRTSKDGRQGWCRRCMNKIMRTTMRAKAAELRAFRLMKAMLEVAVEETS